jgi:hypothetical protein
MAARLIPLVARREDRRSDLLASLSTSALSLLKPLGSLRPPLLDGLLITSVGLPSGSEVAHRSVLPGRR